MNFDKVVACCKELGFKPKVADFSDRLVIQKANYLLQLKGVKADFSYSLYVRGPYSPSLTKAIYGQKEKIEGLAVQRPVVGAELAAVNEFKVLFSGLVPSTLEIAATYAYFAFDAKQDPMEALKNAKKFKQFYSETQLAIGVSKAKEFLFKPSERDVSELKKEFSDWQDAATKSL